MRFSLFELFGWLTFLGMCCAILLRGSHGEAEQGGVLIVWATVAIVFLKLFGWRGGLIVSVFIGVCLGIVNGLSPGITTNKGPRIPAAVGMYMCMIWYGGIGAIIWGIVAIADKAIGFVKNRVNRTP